jgi:hypothetical protein
MSDLSPPPYPNAMPFPPPPAPMFDEQGYLAEDIECKRCSYNLRGLRDEGRCPECGTPIGLSIRGHLLRYSDPNWVEKVGFGLAIIAWMMIIAILVGFVGGFIGAFTHPAVPAILNLGATLVSYYGVWLMTEPDPSGIGEDPMITARKVIRAALLFGVLASAIQLLEVGGVGAAMGPAARITLIAVAVVTVLISLVGEFAKFIYYEQLSRRIPNDSLANRARFLRWAYVISIGVMIIAGALTAIAAALGAGAELMGFACVIGVAGIALLVFGILTIILVFRLQAAVRIQARLARATWLAEPVPRTAGPVPPPGATA